jgi:hypothetical protein
MGVFVPPGGCAVLPYEAWTHFDVANKEVLWSAFNSERIDVEILIGPDTVEGIRLSTMMGRTPVALPSTPKAKVKEPEDTSDEAVFKKTERRSFDSLLPEKRPLMDILSGEKDEALVIERRDLIADFDPAVQAPKTAEAPVAVKTDKKPRPVAHKA